MLILSRLAFSASDALKENNSHVKMLCAQTLQDPESKDVRLAALSATGSIVQAFSSYEEQVSDFQDVIPTMCQVLTGLLNENDQDSSRIALEEFISMAEEAPKFFRKHLDSLIQLAFQIATANNLEEDTRFLAVELLVTLAEQAPAMMRKQKVFLDNMIPLALQLMLTVEEVDMHAWNSTTDDDDDTELTSLDVGKDALDRLALSLGGKTVFGLAFRQDLLPSFMHHEDWKYRHAALTCIAQIAEGCQKQMKQHLESIVMQTAQCFSDAHPRVRWAAINAMGQLETDLGPDLQERYHAVVLPALITVMDDNANPRVQSHAAAAVINFTEDCKKDTVQPYLEGLLGKLLHLLMGGVRIVQEQAITAIASVADCVQDQFKPFYGGIMPVLKDILRNCVHKDQRMLRGKAMECISLIGIAVGKEVFIADAKEVIDQFLNTQTAALDPDDPQISYLLQVWGRLAKALKHDFIPYLNVVMPPLLNSAGIKADDQILDDDQEDEEEEGITTVVVQTEEGAKKVALKTAALEEKSTACNMLVCYFAELKEGMFPFLEQVAHLMIPLLAFIYSEEVRTAAASLMPELIDCAISSMRNGLCNQTFVKGLSDMVFQKLVAMIKEEPEPDVQLAMLESLNESMSFGGDGCLGSPDMVVQVLVALHTVLSEVMERCEKRKKARKDEDFDDDDAENQEIEADRDNDLLESISSNIGTLTKHHAEAVHAAFAKYVEVFGTLVSSPMVTHQRIGICIFDELLENLGEHGQTYMPQLLPALLQFSKDRNSEVRQAAVYGLGICAQYGGSVFGQNAGQVLQCIYENLNHPSAREDSNVYATDNAISALGKIIEFQGQNMEDRNGAITRFVHYLPVTGDKEEGVQVASEPASLPACCR
eukprot:758377-Hanusia_phi.AAC.3